MSTASRPEITSHPIAAEPRFALAESESEREAVRRFWYQVYVEEMGRKQIYANHEAKRIYDPLEPTGRVIVAWEDDQIVGTVRANFVRDGGVDSYVDLYGCEERSDFAAARTSIVTRLMLAHDLRLQNLGIRLAEEIYRYQIMSGIDTVYIDCNSHLVSFFHGLGFNEFKQVQHDEYGDVHVMRLALLEQENLARVRSPFLEHLRLHTRNQGD